MKELLELLLSFNDGEAGENWRQEQYNKIEEKRNLRKWESENLELGANKKDAAENTEDL